MKLEAFAAGLGIGVVIGGVMRGVETSRIAFGPYALYGNGAFAVPVVLAPVAVYFGWLWLMRKAEAPAPAILVFTLATVLGSGLGYGTATGQPFASIGAIVGIGLFFVPCAALAALTVSFLRARRLTSVAALATAYLAGAAISAIPPFAFVGGLGINGISAGAGIVAAQRAGLPAVLALGGALALLALVQAFALPLLLAPLFAAR